MSKISIAFVIDHLRGGGIASMTVNLCFEFIRHGHEASIIVLNNDDCIMQTGDIRIIDLQINKSDLKHKLWDKKNLLVVERYGQGLLENIYRL